VEHFGCKRCWPDTAEAAEDARSRLKGLEFIVDDTHLIVRLLTCEECGQKFLSIMTETIDWADGDDPQYRISIPVTPDEALKLPAGRDGLHKALSGLDQTRRSLHHDWPKDSAATSSWGSGISIMPHD
jgi:hypothetical protein